MGGLLERLRNRWECVRGRHVWVANRRPHGHDINLYVDKCRRCGKRASLDRPSVSSGAPCLKSGAGAGSGLDTEYVWVYVGVPAAVHPATGGVRAETLDAWQRRRCGCFLLSGGRPG
jgi:hypothetical protein